MRAFFSIVVEPLNLALSALTTLTRFWAGWRGGAAAQAPARPIVLYEFEGCPFCRVAREAVSALQLSADIRPCPKGGTHYRPEAVRLGGRRQFPYLLDPNTETRMYESVDIARYLYSTYGKRPAPIRLAPGLSALNALYSSLSLLPRLLFGQISYGRKSNLERPLELWAVEGGPRARLLREVLCALEIPYRLHTRSEPGRSLALVDPNTGASFASSFAARRYLLKTYGG